MIEREELMLDFPFYSMPVRVLCVLTPKLKIFKTFEVRRHDRLQFKIATIDREVVGESKHKINVEVYCGDEYKETIGLRRLQTILTENLKCKPYRVYVSSSAFKIKRGGDK